MPALVNSQRRINKATYVNIRAAETREDQIQKTRIRRPLEKVNFIRSLRLNGAELARISAQIGQPGSGGDLQKYTSLLKLAEVLSKDTSPASNLRFATTMAQIDPNTLADFGRFVASSRRKIKGETQSVLKQIRQKFTQYLNQRTTTSVDDEPAVSSVAKVSDENSASLTHTAKSHSVVRANAGFARPTRLDSLSVTGRGKNGQANPDLRITEATAKPYPSVRGAVRAPSDMEAFDWALEQNDPKAVELHELAWALQKSSRRASGSLSRSPIEDLLDRLDSQANLADEAVNGFVEQFKIEPIGRIHLERLEMTPVGIERGELVYSIPLAPKETVNISHKEWSIKSEEFEKIVQDSLEEFSEEGVTEKNDLSQSTESQNRHATAFSLSGSYSAYGASISVGYNRSSEDQQAQKDSRQQSIALTRKASARAKKEHKHSFKVTSVVGSEDQSVRVITNPSETAAMRVDYYQLIRKWQVDLYRYDLRMTYDIVIPSPGIDLLKKLDDLRVLDTQIDMPFSFSLMPPTINRDNWLELAARWGAKVDPPPKQTEELCRHAEFSASEEEAKIGSFVGIDFDLSPEYTISNADFVAQFGNLESSPHFKVIGDSDGTFDQNDEGVNDSYHSTLRHLHGKTGDLAIIVNYSGISILSVQFTLFLELTPDGYQSWQYNAWNAIREAAEEAYYANRQTLIERREKLAEEIKGWDALTLRKMEREEIMKGVLRWLFGPEFELLPSEIERFFEPVHGSGSSMSSAFGFQRLLDRLRLRMNGSNEPTSIKVLTPKDENWERVIRFGEMIKFLHHAIEWENVLYFTYPYFWDSPDNWHFKRFLQHPDPLHREFLRAGSARVVLTIRPGYEIDFAEFVETGGLGDDHPYRPIAREIQAYARTNYPGIPSANPEDPESEEEVGDRERGILIGRWYEYTPTSALDISIDTLLINLA